MLFYRSDHFRILPIGHAQGQRQIAIGCGGLCALWAHTPCQRRLFAKRVVQPARRVWQIRHRSARYCLKAIRVRFEEFKISKLRPFWKKVLKNKCDCLALQKTHSKNIYHVKFMHIKRYTMYYLFDAVMSLLYLIFARRPFDTL